MFYPKVRKMLKTEILQILMMNSSKNNMAQDLDLNKMMNLFKMKKSVQIQKKIMSI
jgi:hypothetical protein